MYRHPRHRSAVACFALPCPPCPALALPCPALPHPARPCPALPPALPCCCLRPLEIVFGEATFCPALPLPSGATFYSNRAPRVDRITNLNLGTPRPLGLKICSGHKCEWKTLNPTKVVDWVGG